MTWASDIRAVHDEAGGLLEIHVVRLVDLPSLLDRIAVGDPEAGLLMVATSSALQQIVSAPRNRRMLCACCPRPLKRNTPIALVIAAPKRHEPERCLTLAVCTRCAVAPNDVRAKAIVAMRKLWPKIRPVTITHEHVVGRA